MQTLGEHKKSLKIDFQKLADREGRRVLVKLAKFVSVVHAEPSQEDNWQTVVEKKCLRMYSTGQEALDCCQIAQKGFSAVH